MQRIVKPKNARSRRAALAKEPKLIENPKLTIFLRSSQTSEPVRLALTEFYQLKSSAHSIQFSKRNAVRPFEDPSSLQFWSVKNDASLFLIGSHSKKRPHNLTFVRMFDHHVLDMVEVGVQGAVSLRDIRGPKASPGLIPLFHFGGTLWDSNDRLKTFKSVLLDFFRGEQIHSLDLVQGLQYVISVSAPEVDQHGGATSTLNSSSQPTSLTHHSDPPNAPPPHRPLEPASLVSTGSALVDPHDQHLPLVHFRTYLVKLLKSGQREPRVELLPHGPSFDFCLRRAQLPCEELLNLALKRPAVRKPSEGNKKPKTNKNVDMDEMGDKVGRIHIGKQEMNRLQSRKMKGLKKHTKVSLHHSTDEDCSLSETEGEEAPQAMDVNLNEEMGAVVEVSGANVKR